MGFKITYSMGPIKKTATGRQSKKLIAEAFANTFALAIDKTIEKQDKVNERQFFLTLAIFFQRLCARTPLDEIYKSPNAPNGVHKPDEDFTRYHWFIKMGNNKPIYASDLIAEAGYDLFSVYNDENSIEFIFQYLMARFQGKRLYKLFRIKNDTDLKKFRLLEFGGYRTPKNPTIKEGPTEKHGIENGHSVQAPAGMLRTTRGELSTIAASTAKKPLAYRYRDNATEKVLSPKRLAKVIATLKKDGKFYTKDMENLYK